MLLTRITAALLLFTAFIVIVVASAVDLLQDRRDRATQAIHREFERKVRVLVEGQTVEYEEESSLER